LGRNRVDAGELLIHVLGRTGVVEENRSVSKEKEGSKRKEKTGRLTETRRVSIVLMLMRMR